MDRIFNDESSVRRLIGRFAGAGSLRTCQPCYEAGLAFSCIQHMPPALASQHTRAWSQPGQS
jgi:hypothetical protein